MVSPLSVDEKMVNVLSKFSKLVGVEHPMDHTLLVVRRGAQLSIISFAAVGTYKVIGLLGSGVIDQFVNGGRIRVCPSKKEIIRRSGNGSKFCLVAAGCYEYLVIDKQQFVAFVLLTSLFRITRHLFDRIIDGCLNFG